MSRISAVLPHRFLLCSLSSGMQPTVVVIDLSRRAIAFHDTPRYNNDVKLIVFLRGEDVNDCLEYLQQQSTCFKWLFLFSSTTAHIWMHPWAPDNYLDPSQLNCSPVLNKMWLCTRKAIITGNILVIFPVITLRVAFNHRFPLSCLSQIV